MWDSLFILILWSTPIFLKLIFSPSNLRLKLNNDWKYEPATAQASKQNIISLFHIKMILLKYIFYYSEKWRNGEMGWGIFKT